MRRVFWLFLAVRLYLAPFEAIAADDRERGEREAIGSGGDFLQIAIPAYAFGLTLIDEDEDAKWQFLKSFAATQGTVHALKFIVREERPNRADASSFPSGHTAAAVGGAAFIHKRYGIREAVFPYALAIYVAGSRVETRWHDVYDTIAGGLIAIAWVWAFTDENIAVAPVEGGATVFYKTRF
jgi:hypothetical protein